ncbi:MAG TPA: TonB family protein [Candidatus Margulisiibacteriota bacterium]|nr:TonB family protein [Candidatus Margulisiibacteriota bacterium]
MTATDSRRVFPAPPYRVPRRRTAWAVSLAAHAAVLGLVVCLVQRAGILPPPPPARMVWVEPVAPPPPPLGAPLSAPVAPQPVIEEQPPKEVPKPQERQRLVIPHKPKRMVPTPPVIAPPARTVSEGSVGGVVGGVVGGEPGGKIGGVVGGHGDAPVSAERVEHPPVVVSRVLPEYPAMARARGLAGRVVLRAVVDRNGHVEDGITVVESMPIFDTAAVEALRKWVFEPGRDRDGTTVRVVIDVPVRFQLR